MSTSTSATTATIRLRQVGTRRRSRRRGCRSPRAVRRPRGRRAAAPHPRRRETRAQPRSHPARYRTTNPLPSRPLRAAVIVDQRIVVGPGPIPDRATARCSSCARRGLNHAHLAQRAVHPAPPGSPAEIPGLEFAGEVVGLGSTSTLADASGSSPRGRGRQAEMLTVPSTHCVHVPESGSTSWPRQDSGGLHHRPRRDGHAGDLAARRGRARPRRRRGRHAAVQTRGPNGSTVVGRPARRKARTVPSSRARPCGRGAERGSTPPLADEIVAAAGAVDVTIDLVGRSYLATDAQVGRASAASWWSRHRREGRRLRVRRVDGQAPPDPGTCSGHGAWTRRPPRPKRRPDVVPLLASGKIARSSRWTFPLARATKA